MSDPFLGVPFRACPQKYLNTPNRATRSKFGGADQDLVTATNMYPTSVQTISEIDRTCPMIAPLGSVPEVSELSKLELGEIPPELAVIAEMGPKRSRKPNLSQIVLKSPWTRPNRPTVSESSRNWPTSPTIADFGSKSDGFATFAFPGLIGIVILEQCVAFLFSFSFQTATES